MPAFADDFTLDLPLDCEIGRTCHIQQYVDADPGPGARDWMGGPLSYDGHRGTDFRLPDLAAMAAGADVLAPADGRVIGLRDGMADRLMSDPAEVRGRECGNGIVLDHGGGWTTQLCHLAEGSLRVAEGDRVAAGEVVGRVGLSGATQFPHVHLAVRRDGVVVDPFPEALWRDPPDYRPGGLLATGFLDRVPDFDEVKAGQADADTLPRDVEALVLWGAVFGGRAGDAIALTIEEPGGRPVFETEVALDRTQAQLFRAAGRRFREGLDPGTYLGRVALLRDGMVVDDMETTVRIE
jgi:murein DD-endopeptidase MepM/ murein hydrolase activator NlpD